MGCCLKFLLLLTPIVAGVGLYYLISQIPPTPQFEDTWWGSRSPTKEDNSIKPFKVNVPDKVIKDLNERLAKVRPLTPPLENAAHHYGINHNLLDTIVTHWRTSYNWTERQAFLNQFSQYTVSVQGLRLHYLHVKPTSNPKNLPVLPLLLLHGWPGSIREFYDIIPLLTRPQPNRAFVFEVIAPSLPGYGFSEAAVRPGLGDAQMAVVLKNLMVRLGYDTFYVQGGDWGGIIASHLATLFPQHIRGVHSNICFSNTPLSNLKMLLGSLWPSLVATEAQAKRIYPLSRSYSNLLLETGYVHMQATKPDTIGVALSDSPVGLAAYILEKFISWTNPAWKDLPDGGLTKKFTYTDLLDNVMIYWVSNSMNSAMRIYAETMNSAQFALKMDQIPVYEVPYACAKFAHEVTHQLNWVLEDKYRNLVQLTEFDDGGHFAAWEVPKLVSGDLYDAVEKMLPKKNINK